MAATAFGDLTAAQVLDADTINQLGGSWATWTPTWTNLTKGSATIISRYQQIGRTVECVLDVTFAADTSVSGLIGFSLPVTGANTSPVVPLLLYEVGTNLYLGMGLFGSTSRVDLYAAADDQGAGGAYVALAATSSTAPFTWGTTDIIKCSFTYEAAANAVS